METETCPVFPALPSSACLSTMDSKPEIHDAFQTPVGQRRIRISAGTQNNIFQNADRKSGSRGSNTGGTCKGGMKEWTAVQRSVDGVNGRGERGEREKGMREASDDSTEGWRAGVRRDGEEAEGKHESGAGFATRVRGEEQGRGGYQMQDALMLLAQRRVSGFLACLDARPSTSSDTFPGNHPSAAPVDTQLGAALAALG
ncbi:hypothetical protein C8R45DRAFT_935599 [Mycena sanguinolenta]|nr:hypothetical protein C8R45DRAFT_935599 [Mycena sanguinolenta]